MKSAFCIAIVLCAYLFVSNEDFNDQVRIESEYKARRAGVERAADLAPRLKFAHVWAR